MTAHHSPITNHESAPRGFNRRLVAVLLRGRLVLFPLAIGLLAAAWPVSERLEYNRSIESLYRPADLRLAAWHRSKELFGGDEFAMVAWTDPQLLAAGTGALAESAAGRIRELSAQLNRVPGVNAASTQDLALVSDPKPLPISLPAPFDRLVPRLVQLPTDELNTLMRGVLLGYDDHTTAVVLRLKPERDVAVSRSEIEQSPCAALFEDAFAAAPDGPLPVPRTKTIECIRHVAERFRQRQHVETYVVGEPIQVDEMFRYVDEDGSTLFGWSLALLTGVVAVLFRNLRWVALPLLVVLSAVVWTKALLVLAGAQLSMVSSMLNSLVTIIGIATVMHVVVHYRQRRTELGRHDAFRETLTTLLPAVFWTCATTAVGFAALLSSHITPVRSFGLMMALATMLVLVAVALILPGGALLGRFAPDPREAPAEQKLSALLARLMNVVERRPKTIALAGMGVTVFTAAGLARLEVETDFSKNFRADSPIIRSLVFFEGNMGGAGTWEVSFPAPKMLTADYLDKVRKLAGRLRDEAAEGGSQLTKVIALTDPIDAMVKYPVFGRLFQGFGAARQVEIVQELQPEFVETLYNPGPHGPAAAGRMRIVLRAREQEQAAGKMQLIERVRRMTQSWADEELAGEFPQARVESTGLYVLLAHLIQSLLQDQLVSFLLATGGIALMMTIAFRSLRIGLISLVPNLFPIVLVIGSMGWIGLPINIATAMIASVSIGLTVDSTIHYIDAFRRARAAGLATSDALHRTHQNVGRALVFANLALIVGFSVLTLSHFIPLVYFGILLSVAMLGGLAADLLLLPLLLMWTETDA